MPDRTFRTYDGRVPRRMEKDCRVHGRARIRVRRRGSLRALSRLLAGYERRSQRRMESGYLHAGEVNF